MVDRGGGFRFGPIDLQVAYGERIHLTGLNGSGKSTLLRLLTGDLAAYSGTCQLGPSVRVGVLGQYSDVFAGSETLLDSFLEDKAIQHH